jgi:glycosyltransferase involved in cell wall biosynthesis
MDAGRTTLVVASEAGSRQPVIMSLVSVLVPAYNAAATIAETLASALAQTYEDLEVIVVDDGSTDDTAEIVADIASCDPRVILVRQVNGGVANARNTALGRARGSYIAPLDADDLWHPDKLAHQLQCMSAAGSGVGVVYCWSVDIDATSTVIDQRLDLDYFEGDVYAAMVLSNFIGNASVPLIRRAEIDAIGGWDISLRARDAQGCEDWLAYLRLAEITDYALEPGFLVGYRQGLAAMSRNVISMERSHRLVLAEARSRHPELPAKLFRWSAGAFDIYTFEILKGLTSRPARLPRLFRGALRDPQWSLRLSTYRKIRFWMRRLFAPAMPAKARPHPIGCAFSTLDPHPAADVSEGRQIAARRNYVGNLRICRPRLDPTGDPRRDRGAGKSSCTDLGRRT